MNLLPVALEGEHIRLEPLALAHCAALSEIGLDPQIWKWTGSAPIGSAAQMRVYVEAALAQQESGRAAPFATFHKASGRIVGSTRFANLDVFNRSLEIGYTWIAPPWQRTPVNTEAKYLMLRHAFESLGCIRVSLRTDVLNQRSRAAILRLGATQEGILRQEMVAHQGRRRDSVHFGIIDSEWPRVKAGLEDKLRRKSD